MNAAVDSVFVRYKLKNDADTTLKEFKDSDFHLKLKLVHLDLLNKERKKLKLSALQLDILASRIANQMCYEAATKRYVGHVNLKGLNPYQRYGLIGGKDHVSENISGYWTSSEIEVDSSSIVKSMQAYHKGFMDERAPNDLHKKNCIDKFHNYIGIGFYAGAKEFVYIEEFIDRAFVFESVPDTMKINESFVLKVRTQPGQFISSTISYYDKLPKAITVEEAKKHTSYSDFTKSVVTTLYPWDMANYRKGELYEIPLSYKKPGVYYIHLYRDFKEEKAKGDFTTEGKMIASGIVIVVQ